MSQREGPVETLSASKKSIKRIKIIDATKHLMLMYSNPFINFRLRGDGFLARMKFQTSKTMGIAHVIGRHHL